MAVFTFMPWPLALLPLAFAPLAASLRAAAPAAGAGRAKVFFLMMADDRIELEDIWVDFLSGGEPGVTFEAFLHCTDQAACVENVARQDLFTIVPTVYSHYCSDLISPMLALLSAAIRHSVAGNPQDKFAFVSGNSLPVKAFWQVHQTLTLHQEGMATFATGSQPQCGFFKASQWSVLSYWHAERMLQEANRTAYNFKVVRRCTKRRQCTGENWPLVAIYGEDELRKFPVWPKTLQSRGYWWMDWSHLHGHKNIQAERLTGPRGPAIYTAVSAEFLTSFKARDYTLFARKFSRNTTFAGNVSLADAFRAHVFNAGVSGT